MADKGVRMKQPDSKPKDLKADFEESCRQTIEETKAELLQLKAREKELKNLMKNASASLSKLKGANIGQGSDIEGNK